MAFQGVGQVYAGGVDGNVHVMLVLSLNGRYTGAFSKESIHCHWGALTSAHYYLKLILTKIIDDV
ncbi:MAG TPA: hypothetical protein VI278_13345, partial [Nitrososphaeraceae archaeon]